MRWLLAAALLFAGTDVDHDGLEDSYEQELLTKYAPSFFVSGNDCDVLPAEFAPGESKPRAVRRDGTIYAQAFRRKDSTLELHYYHLWSRDCGKFGHPLDAEHVSALVAEDGAKALHWYAAAHEETVCDSARAASADFLSAVLRGPQVWISQGKHGSFFSEEGCRSGCGGDRCTNSQKMKMAKLVNVGEAGAPMNGAVWTASEAWPLRGKMGEDFTAEMITALNSSPGGLMAVRGSKTTQAAILGGNYAVDGLGEADRRTNDALGTATGHTGRALGRARRAVGDWLNRKK